MTNIHKALPVRIYINLMNKEPPKGRLGIEYSFENGIEYLYSIP